MPHLRTHHPAAMKQHLTYSMTSFRTSNLASVQRFTLGGLPSPLAHVRWASVSGCLRALRSAGQTVSDSSHVAAAALRAGLRCAQDGTHCSNCASYGLVVVNLVRHNTLCRHCQGRGQGPGEGTQDRALQPEGLRQEGISLQVLDRVTSSRTHVCALLLRSLLIDTRLPSSMQSIAALTRTTTQMNDDAAAAGDNP